MNENLIFGKTYRFGKSPVRGLDLSSLIPGTRRRRMWIWMMIKIFLFLFKLSCCFQAYLIVDRLSPPLEFTFQIFIEPI